MTSFLNLAGISGVAGFLTAVKISVDIENDDDIMLGDVITLVGNGVMVTAGVVALGTATLPAAGLISVLGLVAAAAGFYANKEGMTVKDLVNSLFVTAHTFIQRTDPLTLDLDGDGLETAGINTANPILFDHNGDVIIHSPTRLPG